MTRFARHAQGELRFTLTDDDDTVLAPSAAPTVTIIDAAGTAVAGSPFTAVEIEPNGDIPIVAGTTGLYRCAIPSTLTATLGQYRATLNATVSAVSMQRTVDYEVVSEYLFAVPELRAFFIDFADANKYPPRRIRLAREAAHDRLEELCRVSFATRRITQSIDGSGKADLLIPQILPSTLIAASIVPAYGSTPVVFSAGDIAAVKLYDLGLLRRQAGTWTMGARNVTLTLEYGLGHIPEPVKRAAMLLAKEALTQSVIPSRAMSESTELGVLRYAIAGRDGWTGIPDVDAIVDQYGRNGVTLGAAGRPN